MAVIRPKGLPQNPRRRAFNTEGVQRAERAGSRGFTRLRAPDRRITTAKPAEPRRPIGSASGLSGRSVDSNRPRQSMFDRTSFGGAFAPIIDAGSNALKIAQIGAQLGIQQQTGQSQQLGQRLLEIDTPLSERLGIPRIEWEGFDVTLPAKYGGGTVNPVNTVGTVSQFLIEEATRPSTLAIALAGAGLKAKAASLSARMGTTATARAQRITKLQNAIARFDPTKQLPETRRFQTLLQKERLQGLHAERMRLQLEQGLNRLGRGGIKAGSMVVEPVDAVKGAGFAGRMAAETGMAVGARTLLEPLLESELPWHVKGAVAPFALIGGAGFGGSFVGQGVKRVSKGAIKYQDQKKVALQALEDFQIRNADAPQTTPIVPPADAPHGLTGVDLVKWLSHREESNVALWKASKLANQYLFEHAWDAAHLEGLTAALKADEVLVQTNAGTWKSVGFEELPLLAGSGGEWADDIATLYRRKRQQADYLVGRIKQRIGGQKGLLDTELDDPELAMRLSNIERSRPLLDAQGSEAIFRGPIGATYGDTDPTYIGGVDDLLMGRSYNVAREELPDELYHVTTDLPAIQRSGRINATTKGLRQSVGEQGLGGPTTNAVSLTESREIAEHLLREFKRIHVIQNSTTPQEFYSQLKQIIKQDADGTFGGKETLDDKSALWEYVVRFMHHPKPLGNKAGTMEPTEMDFDMMRALTTEDLVTISNKDFYDGHVFEHMRSPDMPPDAPARKLFGVDTNVSDDELLDQFVRLIFPEDEIDKAIRGVDIEGDPILEMRNKYNEYLGYRQSLGKRQGRSGARGRSHLRERFSDVDITPDTETTRWIESEGVGFIDPNFQPPHKGTEAAAAELFRNADPRNYGIEVVKKEQIPQTRGVPIHDVAIDDVRAEFDRLKQTPSQDLDEAEIRLQAKLPKTFDELEKGTDVYALLEARLAPSGGRSGDQLSGLPESLERAAGMSKTRTPEFDTSMYRVYAPDDILQEIQVSADIPLGTVENQVFKPKTKIRLRDVIMENGQFNPIVRELGLLGMYTEGPKAGQYFWADRAKAWGDAIDSLQKELDWLREGETAYGVASKDVIAEDLASIPDDVVQQMIRKWDNLGADGRPAPEMPYFGDVVERTNGVNHYFPRYVVAGPNAQLKDNISSLRQGENVGNSIRTAPDPERSTGWDADGFEYQRQMFENVDAFTSYADAWDPVSQMRIVSGTGGLQYLGDVDEIVALRFKAGFNRIIGQWTRNQLTSQMAGMGGMTLTQRIKRIPSFANVIKLKAQTTHQYKDLVDSFQDLPEYLRVRREILNDARARLKGMPPEQGTGHLDSLDPLGSVERGIANEMVPELKRLNDALKRLPRKETGRTGKPLAKYVKNVYEIEATIKKLTKLGSTIDRANSTVLDPKNLEELIELNELAAKQYQQGWNTFDSQLRNKPTLRRQLESATGRSIDQTEREFLDNMDARELANAQKRFDAVQLQLDIMDGYYTRLGIDTHTVAGEDMRALVDEGIRVGKADAAKADQELRRIKAIASDPIDAVEIRTPYGRMGNELTTGRRIPSTFSGRIQNLDIYPNRFWDQEFAERWEVVNNPAYGIDPKTKFGKLYGLYISANNTGRAINAAMDASAFGINGLYLMGASPVTASKAYWRVIQSMTMNPNAWADYVAENNEYILEMARKGIYWGAESDTGEFLFPNWLEKVFNWDVKGQSVDINGKPYQLGKEKTYGIGKAFQLSNIAFSRTGNVVRTEMFKQMYKNESFLASLRRRGAKEVARENIELKDKFKDLSDKQWRDMADTINKATGFSKGGEYSELAGPVFFAPRYMFAQIGFLQKAAVGRGVGANKARDMLLRTAATMGLATELVNRSQGLQTDWNPVLVNDDGSVRPNPSFFKAYIGGHTVSFLGPLDSMIRTLSYIAMDPVEGMKWAVKSKSAPVPSVITEMVTGRTFAGEPVDYTGWFDPEYEGLESLQHGASLSALAIVNQAAGRLPFTFGNVVQDLRDGEMVLEPTKLLAYATNTFGMKAHPTNPYTVLDHAAQRMFDMPYNELNPDDKVAVQEANPKAWYDRNEYAQKMAAFEKTDARKYSTQVNTRKIQEEWWNDQNELMEALFDGTIDLGELNTKYSQRNSARIAELAGNTDEVLYGDNSHANDKRRAVDAWYNAYELADSPLGIDFDMVEEMQRDIMRNASQEVRQYLQYYFQDDHMTHPEAIRWWLREGDVLRDSGYYDIGSNLWPLTDLGTKYSNILGQDVRSMQDLLAAYRTEANPDLQQEMDLDIKWFNGLVTERREIFRDNNPNVDKAGVLYKGWTPRTKEGATALAELETLIRHRYTPWSGSPYK